VIGPNSHHAKNRPQTLYGSSRDMCCCKPIGSCRRRAKNRAHMLCNLRMMMTVLMGRSSRVEAIRFERRKQSCLERNATGGLKHINVSATANMVLQLVLSLQKLRPFTTSHLSPPSRPPLPCGSHPGSIKFALLESDTPPRWIWICLGKRYTQ
jgi:hypothetical protein